MVCNLSFSSNSGRSRSKSYQLFLHYVFEGRSYRSISEQYGISAKTVQRRIDKVQIRKDSVKPREEIILLDTTYFGHDFGVMVFRGHRASKNLHWKYLPYETIASYRNGVEYLREKGWRISGIVCDGRRGMFSAFGAIPIQMCQYHQCAIITRYITQKPLLEAGIELKQIVHQLTRLNESIFTEYLNDWYCKWCDFLKEKSYNIDTGKWHYTHRRIRSAYRSLKTNLPYLFTYQKYPELDLPNTTNSLEGVFSNLKTKLRAHAGLKRHRKMKVIDQYLAK